MNTIRTALHNKERTVLDRSLSSCVSALAYRSRAYDILVVLNIIFVTNYIFYPSCSECPHSSPSPACWTADVKGYTLPLYSFVNLYKLFVYSYVEI